MVTLTEIIPEDMPEWAKQAMDEGQFFNKACAAMNELDDISKQMTASESLYGFMAWLTTRKTIVTFSSSHEAGIAAQLIDTFCKENNLSDPRDDWTTRLTLPST